jgi:hypothetical protein
MAKSFERYRIRSVVISYDSASGTATEGSVAMGIHPGAKKDAVKDQDTILKLQPAVITPAWRNTSMRAGANIDAQKWMHVGRTDDEGISFTIYVKPSGKAAGCVRVTYDVELSYPIPF